MQLLSATLRRGNNNFDLIRLMASLAVMVGHSYGLQGLHYESMLWFTHLESFGSLAVYAFFMISGMLVSASFNEKPSIRAFVSSRVVRIWPAAIVCGAFIAFVLGPSISTLPATTYLAQPQVYGWFARNAALLGRVGGSLPGLFENNHLKSLVNATVWTLPVELRCYLIVLVAGCLGVIGSKFRTLIWVGLLAGIFASFVKHPPGQPVFGDFFTLAPGYSFYPVPFFLLGMMLYAFRDRVWLSWPLAICLCVAFVFLRGTLAGTIVFYLGFIYGVLSLAAARPLLKFRPKHDYSYGIYLYGFVVQQVVAGFFPSMNNYLSLLVAAPFTLALAAASWHLVERPCLRALRRRVAPVQQTLDPAMP